jgi:ComF family protein
VEESEPVLCGHCRTSEPDFDLARCYGLYRANLRCLILQLKFRRRERLGRRLGGYLAQAWQRSEAFREASSVLLVPVPLFQARERERGFNQAQALAEGLANHSPKRRDRKVLQVATDVLARTRHTLPQTSLKFSVRQENVRGAFKAVMPERLKGRQVVLIDDVMTTGATLSACARALKRGGAKTVWALALARSTPQFPDTADGQEAVNVDELRRDWT